MEIPELPSFIKIRCSAQEKTFLKFTYSTYPFSTCVSVRFCASAHAWFHYINIFTFAFRILCTNSNICSLKEAYLLVHWASVYVGGRGGVSVCVMLVGFPQSPLLCGPASSSILLWQLSGTPQGALTTHGTARRSVCEFAHVHKFARAMPMTAALCEPWHKLHKVKFGHASLTLTWIKCQQPHNGYKKVFSCI